MNASVLCGECPPVGGGVGVSSVTYKYFRGFNPRKVAGESLKSTRMVGEATNHQLYKQPMTIIITVDCANGGHLT